MVNFMCFDSQFYQPISILLNIHDLFSVSKVNFAVSMVNLLISLHIVKEIWAVLCKKNWLTGWVAGGCCWVLKGACTFTFTLR